MYKYKYVITIELILKPTNDKIILKRSDILTDLAVNTGLKSIVINELIGLAKKYNIQKLILFELGWKVLKELIKYEGKSIANSGSPREIIKAAYSIYSFIDEDTWLSMLKARTDMSHIYDGNAAGNLVNLILDNYIPEFIKLKDEIQVYYGDILDNL